jgi:hypothetical protein
MYILLCFISAIVTSSSRTSSQTEGSTNFDKDEESYFVPGRRSIFFDDTIKYFHTFPTLEVMQHPPKPLEHPYLPKNFIQYSMIPVLLGLLGCSAFFLNVFFFWFILGIIPEDWIMDRIHNEKEDEIMRKEKLKKERQV